MNINFNTSVTVKGPDSITDFNIISGTVDTPLGSMFGQSTVSDAFYDVFTESTIDKTGVFSIVGSKNLTPIVTNLTPEIATLNNNNTLTRVTDGTAKIRVSAATGIREVSFDIYRSASATVSIFNSYVVGSLAKALFDQMNALLVGKTAGSDQAIFTFSGNTYARNPNVITGSIDLTGINAYLTGNYAHSCALISPRHILGADHFLPTNEVLTFLDRNGTEQTATIIDYVHIVKPYGSGSPTEDTDLAVGYLDTPITNCAYYKVAPPNLMQHLPTIQTVANVPVFHTCFYGSQYVAGLEGKSWLNRSIELDSLSGLAYLADKFTNNGPHKPNYMIDLNPFIQGNRQPFSGQQWQSGSPIFMALNNEAILLGCMTNSGGMATNISQYLPEVQTAMDALSDAHSTARQILNIVDLSAYTLY